MSHWIRWLIVSPVVMLVLAMMMSSCGGSSGCVGSVNVTGVFVVGLCPGQPTATPGFALESINVCAVFATPSPTGLPPTATPTPKHPTPTATPTVCAAPSAMTTVAIGSFVQFSAQGVFFKKKKELLADITNGTNTAWGSNPANIVVNPPLGDGGVYQGMTQGCTCINVSAGGTTSLQYGVAVATAAADCPICPTPVPTSTASPDADAMWQLSAANNTTPPLRVAEWSFNAGAPVAGPITAGSNGRVYFVTNNALLHAIDSSGHQVFDRPAGGNGVAVAPDGTVIAEGTTDWLYGLAANGVPKWRVELGHGGNPLAAGAESSYISAGSNLVSVDSTGHVNWSIEAGPATIGEIIPGGVVVAAPGGDIRAFSSTGSLMWDFAPPGGFSGNLATEGGTVYGGSKDGAVFALDSDTGTQNWTTSPTGIAVEAGPAVGVGGEIYFSAAALYAIDSSGASMWNTTTFVPAIGALATDAVGDIFVGSPDGSVTSIDAAGSPGWSTRSTGKIVSIASSPSGEVYVAGTDGRVWAFK